jgi:phage gp37-like protein
VDLTDLQAWNERLEQVDDVAALRTASLAAETQAMLDDAVEKGDPRALQAVQRILTDQ